MKPSKESKAIIILGPPGAGKGTQAELLADELGIEYVETAKTGERRIKESKKGQYVLVEGKRYYFEDQKKLWLEGKLWDPPFVTVLIKEEIKKIVKERKGVVFGGSPRTLYEAERVIPYLSKLYGLKNVLILLIEVSPKASIWRNSHRRICQLMRHPIIYTKETASLKHCPLDGSKLIKRKGLDDPETIKTRLKEYEGRTLPVIQFAKKEKVRIARINGEQAVANVFGDIVKAMGR